MPEGISGAAERRKPRGPEWSKLSPQAALPTIQRRWRLIALVVVAGMTLAGLALWLISPRYTSEMMLLFESKRNPVEADTELMMEGRPQDDVTIVGEIQVIRSRDLARKVIDELGLASDPEFAGTQPAEGDFVGAAWVAVKNIFMPVDSGMEMIIDNFLDGLRVTQVTGSPAVLVRYTSKDRDKSAKILATIANSFMISRLENRLQNAKWVGAWLSERIQGMRGQVETAERSVAEYRKKYGLVAGEKTALINERISKLSVEFADAVAARQTAEAKVLQANRSLQRPETAASSRMIDSDLIQRLRQRQVELEQRGAELGQSLGSRHPQMIQLQAERQKLAAELRAEIVRLADSFEYDARVARAREQGVKEQLDAAKQELGASDQASVGLRALEREADSNRLMLERFMNLVPQISAQSDVQAALPNARIISSPNTPDSPSFPQPIPFLAVSLLASLGLGVLLALFADYLGRRTFVSAEEAEATTRLPVLAVVPLTRGSGSSDISQQVLDSQRSIFSEAISALFTRMVLAHRTHTDILSNRQEIKSVAFTSCQPGEGKSTIALSLARQQARCGRRVVLIDADFAMSRLAGNTGLSVEFSGVDRGAGGQAGDRGRGQEGQQITPRYHSAGTNAHRPCGACDLFGDREHCRPPARQIRAGGHRYAAGVGHRPCLPVRQCRRYLADGGAVGTDAAAGGRLCAAPVDPPRRQRQRSGAVDGRCCQESAVWLWRLPLLQRPRHSVLRKSGHPELTEAGVTTILDRPAHCPQENPG